ncbi:WSC-domain-containing protein [Rhizophagus irregularis]|uniref:WSC-domain-containing protein n=1 Tax=Rhizophagus irregularis TaxID=588596 RepID=A0A2I1EFX3_9GLOM|nr:WSC-domain-containing protein [Rhizophagus irregularis]PKY21033.1 WSC-domain-containing protein [Rhizophagus irregularis]CAB4488779.1 unnamed protein product [Rhizophagus irregularis]CAB5365233.1 unnamed protein product [Rhizophagus irregularis]
MACVDKCDENGEILRYDPQVTPVGCFVRNNSTYDKFNGLAMLKNPSRPGLIFPDPYTTQNYRIIGFCLKTCIDLKFDYAAVENSVNCRCGYEDAILSYIKVDDDNCNLLCPSNTFTGKVNYPCGGKGAYTVYKAEIQDYNPPYNITIEEKLNIMYNIDKDKKMYPYYKGCIRDDSFCGKRVLGNSCLSSESMTVDECIDHCHKDNYKYAGLEARTQCFCGNSYDSINRLLGSEHCRASCPGNNSQICGGIWALSIYEVHYIPVGLIVGLIIGISAIIVVTFLFIRRRSRHNNNNNDEDGNDENEDDNDEAHR